MTDIELKKAITEYKMQLEGQKMMLECFANQTIQSFANQFFSNVNESRISAITEDEILRNVFLTAFHNTKESSNLMVYLNEIQRLNCNINEGQPDLESVNPNEEQEAINKGLKILSLYCDLETDKPILIEHQRFTEFRKKNHIIMLPYYSEIHESYRINNGKISKGSQEKYYNRLQLYYFKELLTNSQDEVIKRILKKDTIEKICLDK